MTIMLQKRVCFVMKSSPSRCGTVGFRSSPSVLELLSDLFVGDVRSASDTAQKAFVNDPIEQYLTDTPVRIF